MRLTEFVERLNEFGNEHGLWDDGTRVFVSDREVIGFGLDAQGDVNLELADEEGWE